jgi:hypothetical protein
MTFPSDDLGGDPPCWSHLTAWPEDNLCDRLTLNVSCRPFTVTRTRPSLVKLLIYLEPREHACLVNCSPEIRLIG